MANARNAWIPVAQFGASLAALAVVGSIGLGCESATRDFEHDRTTADTVSTQRVVAPTAEVQVFLVETAPEGAPVPDTGFGCGDRLVPIAVSAVDAGSDAAVQALLDQPDTLGLITALHPSSLSVDSVEIESGAARVHFSGTLSLGGVCDHPRVVQQLNATVRAAAGVDSVAVFVNGQPLSEYLSLRG